MIWNIFISLQQTIFFSCMVFLIFLPGCKKPYEHLKRVAPVKAAHEKQRLVRTMSKENLSKNIKDMNLQEALKAKEYYEELGREDMIMLLLPHIVSLSKDVELVAQLELEFADRHLSMGNLEEAQKLYANFITFYPGDANIKKARYHQLLATFWTALEPDREQILLRNSVDLSKNYLKDFPTDIEYTPKVHEILKASYMALLEGELGLVKFYLNKYTYERKPTSIEAARGRLNYIKESYLPVLAFYDERAKTLAESLEAIEKLVSTDDQALVREQLAHVAQQVNLLEVLLLNPGVHYRVHPRDTF